jgi:hypothetical protein
MRNHDIDGTSTQAGFEYWMHERHSIWEKRNAGLSKPWTTDEIFQKFKFTNVFRELDRGTLALRRMQDGCEDAQKIVWSTWWYRCFNRDIHAEVLSVDSTYTQVREYMLAHEKPFTSAHIVHPGGSGSTMDNRLAGLKFVWKNLQQITQHLLSCPTMQAQFNYLLQFPSVGPFGAYELVSDFRWNIRLPLDTHSWCSIHVGSRRGLRRLNMPTTMDSIRELYSLWTRPPVKFGNRIIPFEYREVEHSLCEFDKYERIRLGQGRPRGTFNGL